jgi:hypothetical protein
MIERGWAHGRKRRGAPALLRVPRGAAGRAVKQRDVPGKRARGASWASYGLE